MANPFGVPEISAKDVAQKLAEKQAFIWLDVREAQELTLASIKNATVHAVPLSQLRTQGINALPVEAQNKEAEIVVSCHHGGRSAQVAAWLQGQGWNQVYNLDGGIDAWAREVDPSTGRY